MLQTVQGFHVVEIGEEVLGKVNDRKVIAVLSDHLHPDCPFGFPRKIWVSRSRNGYCWQSCQTSGHSENIVHVRLDRTGILQESNVRWRSGCSRHNDHIHAVLVDRCIIMERMWHPENSVKVSLYHPPNLLGLDEIIVHRASAQAVCSQQNSPLDLGAQVVVPVSREKSASIIIVIRWASPLGTIPNTIVFGQVRRSFGGSKNVI